MRQGRALLAGLLLAGGLATAGWAFGPRGAGTATSSSSVIATPTDVSDDLRLYQFTGAYSSSGNTYSLAVAGTISGGTPSSINCAVVDSTDHTSVIVGPVTMSVAGSAFSGSLSVPTRIGSNNIGCWDSANAGSKTYTNNRFFVGLRTVWLGESNNLNMETTSGSPPSAAAGTVRWYTPAGSPWWATPIGNGERTYLNQLSAGLGMATAGVEYAVNGTTVSNWISPDSTWNAFCSHLSTGSFNNDVTTNSVAHGGGDFYIAHWDLGENDAIAGTSKATWKSSFATVVGQILSCSGRSASSSGLGITMIGDDGGGFGGGTDQNWSDIRAANFEAVAASIASGAFYLGTNYDLPAVDLRFHYAAASYGVIGARSARAVLNYLGVPGFTACGGKGPAIASVTAPAGSTTELDFNITHNGCGTGLRVTGGGTSAATLTASLFRCFKDGTPLVLSSPSFSSPSQIRWTSGAAFDTSINTVVCDYAFGKIGDTTSKVLPYDNAPPMGDAVYPGLPLEPTDGQLTVALAQQSGLFLSEAMNDFAPYQGLSNNGAPLGTNGNYYSQYLQLAWQNAGGDWTDRVGVAQGSTDYSSYSHPQNDAVTNVSGIDVKQLLTDTAANVQPEVMLHYASGGIRYVTSRFDPTTGNRPSIHVVYGDATSEDLPCLANTSLLAGTANPYNGGYRSAPVLTISGDGTGATGHLVSDLNGSLTGVVIDTGGSGYTTAAGTLGSADYNNGGGTGATVSLTVGSGAVTGGTVTNPRGTAWSLQFGGGTQNIVLRFSAPNPAKTISTATMSWQIQATQFSGTATFHVMKVRSPVVTAAVETGVANNVVQDANLGAQAGVIAYFDAATYGSVFTQNAIDYANGNNYNYTSCDVTKIPCVSAGKFLAPTDAQFSTYPLNQTGPKPTVVDCNTDPDCAPLKTGTTPALKFHVDASCVGNPACGSNFIIDNQYYFKPTDTGNQSHSFVDGSTIPIRATHDVAVKFSTTAGSSTVTVKDAGHGASTGAWVRIPYHVAVGGVTVGGDETDWYKITVVDADHYTFSLLSWTANQRQDLGYVIASNVVRYAVSGSGGVPRVSIGAQIKIVGSANSALNGTWPISAAALCSDITGSTQVCVSFAVTTANAGPAHDDGATVTFVPGSTVVEGGQVASYGFTGNGQVGPTVTLPGHGYYSGGVSQYSQRAVVTVGGVSTGAYSKYDPGSVTANTFVLNLGTSSGCTSGCSSSINGGNVRLEYASGNPLPIGKLPQEVYVRWYEFHATDLYLSDDFGPNSGGKWGIGFAHRTDYTGNGGACGNATVPLEGKAGWTEREQYKLGSYPNDPLYRNFSMGSYSYSSTYCQEDQMWAPGTVVMNRGQWYCIEVRMKMNTFDPTGVTPAAADGIIEAWMDGRKVFSKLDYLWRKNPPWYTPLSASETPVIADAGHLFMWWNVYMGGVNQVPTQDWDFFATDLVISTVRVGPMKMSLLAQPKLRMIA